MVGPKRKSHLLSSLFDGLSENPGLRTTGGTQRRFDFVVLEATPQDNLRPLTCTVLQASCFSGT